MVIEFDCDHGDYSSGENKIDQFEITHTQGLSVEDLKRVELAAVASMFRLHVLTHPYHTAMCSFSIPKGYEVRNKVIYKSSPKRKK